MKEIKLALENDLYNKIKQAAMEDGFSSVAEYIIFILREFLLSEETEEKRAYSKEEEEKIRERLRHLGYLE